MFIIERKLIKQGNQAKVLVLIHWKNTSPSKATWEFLSNLYLLYPSLPLWSKVTNERGNVMGSLQLGFLEEQDDGVLRFSKEDYRSRVINVKEDKGELKLSC